MGWQVEGQRQTLSAFRQTLAQTLIARLGAGKTGVLAQCPRSFGVHAGVRAANERGSTGMAIEVLQTLQVTGQIHRF
jgi:hypothetical protein